MNCRSSVTLNESTLVATRSLVRDRNGPFSENGAFWSNVTGKMLVCRRAAEERVVETSGRIESDELPSPTAAPPTC